MTATVVLVHGGCVGPWEWERVAPRLERQGLVVHAPALRSVGDVMPLGGLHDDADAVRSLLDSVVEPVVVCAHSYGGAVITEACSGPHPSVRHLVYLTAFMPDDGETGLSLLSQGGGSSDGIDVNEDGTFGFNVEAMVRDKVHLGWAESEARALAVRHQRQCLDAATEPVQGSAWKQIPSTYVRCTRDEMIGASLAEIFGGRASDVAEMAADHDPQWTHPDEVATLILEIASRY